MRGFLIALWLLCLLPVIVAIGVTGRQDRKSRRGDGKSFFSGNEANGPAPRALNSEFFLKKAAREGLGETELCKIALCKSASGEVRRFARQLLDDRASMTRQLERIAYNLGEALPREPDAALIDQVRSVRDLPDADFDAACLRLLAREQRATIHLFGHAAGASGLEPQVKHFAAHFLPVLADRQSHLRDLQHHLS